MTGHRPLLVDQLLAEPVAYGPFVLTRRDIYRVALAEGHGRAAADWFAFGAGPALVAEPITVAALADELDARGWLGRGDRLRALAAADGVARPAKSCLRSQATQA